MASTNVDWKPEVEMRFDNMEDAKQFWLMVYVWVKLNDPFPGLFS